MKYTIEDIHDYLVNNWYDPNELSDFNMAMDSGFTDYGAYLIKSGGALNLDNPIERFISKMLEGYNPNKDIKECFGNSLVFINKKTNEHLFIKNDYVDYMVSLNDFNEDWEISK